eukprot:34366-Eustigmatos_ZCMA.PRE.1
MFSVSTFRRQGRVSTNESVDVEDGLSMACEVHRSRADVQVHQERCGQSQHASIRRPVDGLSARLQESGTGQLFLRTLRTHQ